MGARTHAAKPIWRLSRSQLFTGEAALGVSTSSPATPAGDHELEIHYHALFLGAARVAPRPRARSSRHNPRRAAPFGRRSPVPRRRPPRRQARGQGRPVRRQSGAWQISIRTPSRSGRISGLACRSWISPAMPAVRRASRGTRRYTRRLRCGRRGSALNGQTLDMSALRRQRAASRAFSAGSNTRRPAATSRVQRRRRGRRGVSTRRRRTARAAIFCATADAKTPGFAEAGLL